MRLRAGFAGSVLVMLVAGFALGCTSSRLYFADPGPYDEIPEAWRAELAEARAALDAGRARDAHAILLRLTNERPEHLAVAIFLQEVEHRLLSDGYAVGGFRVAPESDVAASLGDVYRNRADARPSAARYVLAARLATGPESALEMLEQARIEDPECVWVYYAIAWWRTHQRLYPAARAAVEKAFDLDGGHPPTMRLHATHLAGAGELEPAIQCLEVWLDHGASSPLIARAERAEARVDLAALYLLDEDPAQALGILTSIDRSNLTDPARAELLRAVTLDDLDEGATALSAARYAYELAPGASMALVYQALLQRAQGNVTQERKAWERLLALLDEQEAERKAERALRTPQENAAEQETLDFAEVLIRLRARVRLERLSEAAPMRRPLATP